MTRTLQLQGDVKVLRKMWKSERSPVPARRLKDTTSAPTDNRAIAVGDNRCRLLTLSTLGLSKSWDMKPPGGTKFCTVLLTLQ